MTFSAATASKASKSRKFPVFSLMIREFDGGEQFASDCVIRHPSSGIFAGKSKIMRTFAHYSLPKRTGDGHIPSSSAESKLDSLGRESGRALYANGTIGDRSRDNTVFGRWPQDRHSRVNRLFGQSLHIFAMNL